MSKLHNIILVLTLVGFCSCRQEHAGPATGSLKQGTSDNLTVLLDCSDAPELESWGKNAIELAGKWYPIISELLNGNEPAPPRTITIVIGKMEGIACTSGNHITIAISWIGNHPDDTGVLIHELVHVVQDYRVPTPSWIVEGIADYIRFFRYENQWDWECRIDPDKSHYTDGYRTSAAFLRWIAATYCEDADSKPVQEEMFLRKLHQTCREGVYSDDFFVETTGKTLDTLWKEFTHDLKTTTQ